MTTVRTLLEVAAAKDWPVHQMDVHNAFLHGDLDEEVYMQLPPGFRTNDKTQVCRLRKSLYGLQQAPRCWFSKLSTALKDYGFTQSVADYSLFTYAKGTQRIYVLVYVDDLILAADSLVFLDEFKTYLSDCFHMKDLGVLKYFLGIEVARNPSGFYLCQRKYAMDIITETGLSGVKLVAFPLDQNHKLALDKGKLMPDSERYRCLVGRLIYLANTRPDLAYSIHILTQFMKEPREAHWDAALRVVRYLKQNPGQGILLRSDSSLKLKVWCDADWGGCPLTRKSLTGWFIQLGDSPISWKTSKQDNVSMSSCEAEYRALSLTVREVLWLKNLLLDFDIYQTEPIIVHCDNMAAIQLSQNPVFHERTKHIERDCHFIRDEIIRGTVATQHVSSKNQLADILTKALGRKEFEAFKVKLGIYDLYAPT
ncbi:Retrovirus-related Pol polyprotein from transposon RE2 [Cardamine amara subsp. amara]|uniref:Retrovirus-related Pol polyprotein from transposon RE2 n=1 Tax=Cardamine amara subsp. amara TaxID=228776 RepID=A0ABD0Z954_CARAN